MTTLGCQSRRALDTCGGDAEKVFAGRELVHAVSPELTLYGIALAYANHHIKHGT